MGEYSDRELEQLLALDGAAGPAQSLDPARSASIIAAALHSAGFPPPGAGGSGAGGSHGAGSDGIARHAGRAARHAAGRATLTPKLTVLAGGAVAVAVAVVTWFAVRAPDTTPPVLPEQTAVAQTTTARTDEVQTTTAQTEGVQTSLAQTEVVRSEHAPTDDAPTDRAPTKRAPTQLATGEPPRVHVPLRSPSKLHATATPSHRRRLPAHTAPVATAADPEDLLAEANAARLARDWRGADALYTRVASAGGATLAAQTALVASAQLHLEHLGDADGAARRFRRALTAGAQGALAEEARWGLADVARVTGDRAAERRALDDFLAHHAASVRAAQARARRTELEASP